MSPLERRCRWLLSAYPRQYRADRADEILGTLLETATPGRRWPSARESAALIAGGLRARTGTNASMPAVASVRLAAMLACATFLGVQLGFLLADVLFWPAGRSSNTTFEWITYAGLFATTILIWFVRRELAVLALLAFLAAGYSWGVKPPWIAWTVLVLAVLTALRTERPPKAWLAWFCLPLVFVLLRTPPVWRLGPDVRLLSVALIFGLLFLFVLGPLAWAVTDARPAFALAILGVLWAVVSFNQGIVGNGVLTYVYAAGILLAALPLPVRMVRRRRRATV
jgi:hypothetical protein